MTHESQPRDNPLNWSFRIGALFGITIRIHLLFVLGAVLILFLAFHEAPEGRVAPSVFQSLGLVTLLFLIVLIHEFGHCWGARYSGGEATEILLWPLGGLATVRPPHTPKAHAITVAAGPAVNVIFCLCSGMVLLAAGGISAIPLNPFFALSDALRHQDLLLRWSAVFFALNYFILLFNLIPMYPLDGGRMLHAMLWPKKGFRQATLTATFVGMIGALCLGLLGVFTQAMMLIMIAVFGYITCYNDRRMARMHAFEESGEFGYDFSQGYAAFDEEADAAPRKPGLLERRRIAKAEARARNEAERSRLHQQRVDEVLAKVHRSGIDSLTAEERRILEQETERQRTGEA